MSPTKTDRYRLARIAEIGEQLLEVVERRGITAADIDEDVEIQWLITTPLYNIGEQTNCLSSELTSAYPNIPWAQIAGLRHRLVHNYKGTNWSMVSEVVLVELDGFVDQVKAILESLPNDAQNASVESEN